GLVAVEVEVIDDPARACSAMLLSAVLGGGHVVLTGGSTPRLAYQELAQALRSIERDFGDVTFWFGDERCVPPGDERSNYRLAKETLLDRVEGQPREVHRIRGELQPADAAGELDKALAGVELDLLLLGLGPDGHVASLFPGSPQLDVEDRRATSGPAGLEPWVERVTMTMPTLRSAHRIVFLVTGEAKADAVVRAFEGDITREVPATLLRLAPVRVEAFLDGAAASRLGPG